MTSKDTWQQIEEELKGSWPRVSFKLDSKVLAVRRKQISENKTALAVYIDDQIDWSWGWPDSSYFNSFVERIWRKRSKSIYSPAKIKKMEKDIGKRRVRKICPDINKKLEWYDPTFNTAASLVRQYKKLEGLELIELNGIQVGNKQEDAA